MLATYGCQGEKAPRIEHTIGIVGIPVNIPMLTLLGTIYHWSGGQHWSDLVSFGWNTSWFTDLEAN